jgi:hypothetical protein
MRLPRIKIPTCLLRAAAIALLSALALPVAALEGDSAIAYARDGGRLLYREEHFTWTGAGVRYRLVLYRCPDGAPFARKTVVYRGGPAAPDFDFEDGRDGYREGVRSGAGGREVYFRTDRAAPLEVRALPAAADAVIDAGFDEMVRAEWDRLGAGGRVSRPFLIPSRFDYVAVRIDGNADADAADGPVRRLRMRIDRWFGFLVPPIDLTYSRPGRRLLEFSGIGTIRAADGRHQDVRIEFPRTPPPAPTAAALAQARTVALVRACAST